MPTYEYQCKKCGYTFEKFQSITAKPLQNCPKCNGEVFRLISKNGSFILKGSGYYSTDNRKSQALKENKSISGSKTKKKTEKTTTEQKKTVTPKSNNS
jgi:putative FmdB family regulatory protein